jgi:hypothetical protein
MLSRNTLNISKGYTNLKEKEELGYTFIGCFEDWKRVLVRNSSFVYQYQKQQLSFYFLYLISKNYLQRLDAIKTEQKNILYIYQNIELGYLFTSRICQLRPPSNDYCAK